MGHGYIHIDPNSSTALIDAIMQNDLEQQFGKGLVDRLATMRDALLDIEREFNKSQAHIVAYSNPAGLELNMGELRQEMRRRLDNVSGPLLKDLVEREQSYRARLVPAPPKLADQTALHIERRQLLRDMDRLNMKAEYLESCRVRDELTWAAIETCANYDPIRLDAETLAAGQRIRSELENPDVISQLRETTRLRDAVETAVSTLETRLGIRIDKLAQVATREIAFY